jgi:hypothetical protein
VIILDTNQLEYAQPPDGALLVMLKTVALHAGHQLCLPEMALEEYLAHYDRDVATAQRQLTSATETLRRLVRGFTLTVPDLRRDRAVVGHEAGLKEVFQILPTPDGVWREALIREARRLPPARSVPEGPGAGARDAVIWLTAVLACRERQEETYFVSKDNAAFGKGDLRTELAEELSGTLGILASGFHYCYGVEGLLDLLGTKYSQVPGEEEIAKSALVLEAVAIAMRAPELLFQLMRTPGLRYGFGGPSGNVTLTFINARRTMAYRIAESTWACGELIWQVSQEFTWMRDEGGSPSSRNVNLTFKVRTTLVMQLGNSGEICAAEVGGVSPVYEIRSNFDW